ncbi:T9SS type A sorting domain-containing protein [bacterium]|nr:T9SS type A sorting domain-containing protein [bacterium]
MSKRAVVVFILSAIFATRLVAQDEIAAKFQPRHHPAADGGLPYRLFVPANYTPTRLYPLVLALHGSGERGSDNFTQVRSYRLATAWADPINQTKYPCLVVAPQCPLNQGWDDHLMTLSSLLDSLQREFSIDANRLYVTGLSMGGFATWDLITLFPKRFAAAIPMSAGGDPARAATIAAVPIWNFHGTRDDAVPVSFSRDMMTALQQAGQEVVYTHCRDRDCTGLPDSTISQHVRSHANLLYTEYGEGGHVIWDESYDYSHLFPWVFQKYRQTPGALQLTNLKHASRRHGLVPVEWQAGNPADSVEIWFSSNAGEDWELIARALPNNGIYLWNTVEVTDCAFGVLKIFLQNDRGFIYSQDRSGYLTIDNQGNGAPFVRIRNDEFRSGEVFDQERFTLALLLGDAEDNPLTVNLFYSTDGGQVFSQFDTFTARMDTLSQSRAIDLTSLPNSPQAVIRVAAGDGQTTAFAQTFPFAKLTPRVGGPVATHVTGNSGARVTVQVVAPEQLTGHLYRVTFDTLAGRKFYHVVDRDRQVTVVEKAGELDGASEGPLFDGVRLVIKDYPRAEVDLEGTRFTKGQSTLKVAITVPRIDLGTEVLEGYPQPADYRLEFFDHVVDTSSTAYGAAAVPMKFLVQNLTANRPVEIIFLDNDADQSVSLFDEIFLVEPVDQSALRLTWSMLFTGTSSDRPPAPGDEFTFRTHKPLTTADVYEFYGRLTGVHEPELHHGPAALILFPNYPNPFNPATNIRYHLPQPALVRVSIHDLQGREVARLFEGWQSAGTHALSWLGSNAQGEPAGSGVFFCRISAGEQTMTRKLLLLR